jgi:metallophosphoesterase (TIGR00282 family)
MNILFVGDVFASAGRHVTKVKIKELRERYDIDLCIANCENAASGRGITEKIAADLFNNGIDVLTGGNHLWDRKESFSYLKMERRIVKPANYPKKAIGFNYFISTTSKGKVAIINLCGQAFMNVANSPFIVLEELIEEINDKVDYIFVDFHAEATAEKRSFGFYFDGQVSAIVGTHTHIQTADEEILPKGTAYITDVGMTGSHDSVIGIKKEIIIEKMMTGMPMRYEPSKGGLMINAVVIEFDDKTKKAISIFRIREKV